MATEDPTRKGAGTNAREDRRTERAVLALLLHEYPTRLTLDELAWVLHGDPGHQDPADAAERAVGELVASGLLQHEGALLCPTRAALHFDRLELD